MCFSLSCNNNGVATALPGRGFTHPEGQNKDGNEDNLRKYEKTGTQDCEAGYATTWGGFKNKWIFYLRTN